MLLLQLSNEVKKNYRAHLHLQASATNFNSRRASETQASARSHTLLHTNMPTVNLFTQFAHFLLSLLSSSSRCLVPQQQSRQMCVRTCTVCPAFSRCNKPLIMKSTQACLTPLLLPPPHNYLPLGCTLFDTHWHRQRHVRSCGYGCKRGTRTHEIILNMKNWDWRLIIVQCDNRNPASALATEGYPVLSGRIYGKLCRLGSGGISRRLTGFLTGN